MSVAITGAAGEVGRVVADAFDPDDRQLFTHNEHDDLEGELLDITDRRHFCDRMEGTEVLVHAAWIDGSEEGWDEGTPPTFRPCATRWRPPSRTTSTA